MKYKPEFLHDEFHAPTKHFWFKGADGGVIYPLIQKNGCSSFKKFLDSRIHYRCVIRQFWDTVMLRREDEYRNWPYWQIQINTREASRHKFIFIYRDPFERIASAFTNKFIDNSGNKKFFQSFVKVMNKNPEQSTFRDFLVYASKPFEEIDVHLWPQKSRLCSVAYQPIKLENIFQEMKSIVGPEVAELYFAKPTNASYKEKDSFKDSVVDLSVAELRRAKSLGITLKRDDLATAEVSIWVRKIYWQDYEMIENHIESAKQ